MALFNLAHDAVEVRDLSGSVEPSTQMMKAALERALSESWALAGKWRAGKPGQAADLDRKTLERLKSLGYVK